jgi:GWxTD domain-containing protein
MFRSMVLTAGAVAGLASTPLPGWQARQASSGESVSQLAVRAIRFYRADQNVTRVKTFVEVPYALLEPAPRSTMLTYDVDVVVMDSAGLTLLRQRWQGHGRADLRTAGASTVEIIDFPIKPGLYRLKVTISDSVSGRSANATTEIRGFDSTTPASDLWLAPQIREASTAETVPGPGEVWQGKVLVTAAPRLVLTPTSSNLYYLVEVYSSEERSGTMTMTVLSPRESSLVQASRPVTVSEGGGVLTGQMDLTGLPPGDYRMRLSLAFDQDTVKREADFTMRGMQQALTSQAAVQRASGTEDEAFFGAMTPKQLDEALAPLTYLAKPGELSAYSAELSLLAKRRFLNEFWKRRDPTPDSPTNETRDQFYRAIAYANREFKEGGRASVPGWKSDRGRIYAKLGIPDDVLRRQQEGTAPRYEVWRYTRERNRYYIFADRTGFGAFNLIASNDVHENGVANWREILGYYALEDIGDYLGMPGGFSAQ